MSEKISDQSVPVQEIKTPTVVSVKKFMKSVLVVVLSFMCICVGVLIYQLHEDFHPVYGKKTNARPTIAVKSETKVLPLVAVPKKEMRSNPEKRVAVPMLKAPETPMMSMPIEAKTEEPKTVKVAEPKTETRTEPAKVKEEKTTKEEIVPEKVLPLSVALDLRDKLTMGETCVGELSLLMSEKLPEKADKAKILNALMAICTDVSAYKDLKNVFNQEKKDALTTFYRMTSSSKWTAYMKAIWTTLVDVRRLNPVKKRPKDIVSLAQNALNQYNVAEAIILVETLPPEMQADFQGFLGQAKAYILAQEAVDSLVFAYEMGGK